MVVVLSRTRWYATTTLLRASCLCGRGSATRTAKVPHAMVVVLSRTRWYKRLLVASEVAQRAAVAVLAPLAATTPTKTKTSTTT
jgi:hypothetical protein